MQNDEQIIQGPSIEAHHERETHGPLTLSNGAIYTGERLNGMKDGYGQQVWPDGSKYDG